MSNDQLIHDPRNELLPLLMLIFLLLAYREA